MGDKEEKASSELPATDDDAKKPVPISPDKQSRRISGIVPSKKDRDGLVLGTYRLPRNFPYDTNLQTSLDHARQKLSEKDPKESAKVPPKTSLNDWIAVHILLYYNEANIFIAQIATICTCKKMAIGPYDYMWADGKNIINPISIPAIDYIDYLLEWIESYLDDTKMFPQYDGQKYDKNFLPVAKNIFKRIFRVFGHILYEHAPTLEQANLLAKYESILRSFLVFVKMHKLVSKEDLHPLHRYMVEWKEAGLL